MDFTRATELTTDVEAAVDDAFEYHKWTDEQQEAGVRVLAFSLIWKDLQFHHTTHMAPLHVQSINSTGMVTLRELPGEFAPHLFKEYKEAGQ
jgi:hypothetical protein